jgi:hypothetical protein
MWETESVYNSLILVYHYDLPYRRAGGATSLSILNMSVFLIGQRDRTAYEDLNLRLLTHHSQDTISHVSGIQP